MKITETECLRRKRISEYAKERYKNNSFIVTCNKCGKEYKVVKSKYDRGRGKYCSKECQYIDKKGVRYSIVTEFKKGQGVGEHNVNWKGDNVTKDSLHIYINRHFDRPDKCEMCKKPVDGGGRFEWSNKSRTYKTKNRSDWQYICRKCHVKYDDMTNKAWVTKRTKLSKL